VISGNLVFDFDFIGVHRRSSAANKVFA